MLPRMLRGVSDDGVVVEAFVKRLSHPAADARCAAALCLGAFGTSGGVQALLGRVKDPGEDLPVRLCAADALGHIGDVSAVQPLTELLGAEPPLQVRLAISQALERIRQRQASAPGPAR